MGLVVSMAMFLLALLLSSFLSLDLQGAGIAAGVYSVITALLSAFTAGYFAIKASAPELLFGDGTDIAPQDATLSGVITAAAIIVITTFTAVNGATSAIRTAGGVVGRTVSAVGSATGSVAGAVGSIASGAGMAEADGLSNQQITGKLQQAYQKATGNISRDDIERFIAKNSANLAKAQVSAVADVLEDLLAETKQEANQLDFTDLDTLKNLDSHAKARLDEIEKILTGDELITRLQNKGLTQEQANQVRSEAVATYQEYKAQSEKAVASVRQTIDEAKQKADMALQQAEETARKAALYTGLFGLIGMILTFFASIAGAKKAAASVRRTY